MLVDAAGEQVVHQPGLDAPLLGDQRLRLRDGPVHRGQHLGDGGLLGFWREGDFDSLPLGCW